jgi:hypothetical protein
LEDEENTYLYFTYPQSINFEIEINGTKAIPEFPSTIIVLAALMVAILLLVIYKSICTEKFNLS